MDFVSTCHGTLHTHHLNAFDLDHIHRYMRKGKPGSCLCKCCENAERHGAARHLVADKLEKAFPIDIEEDGRVWLTRLRTLIIVLKQDRKGDMVKKMVCSMFLAG